MAKVKYDIEVKGDFLDKYPRLKSITSGIDFTNNNIKIDSLVRYIVFYYSVWSTLHTDVPEFTQRKKHALSKFKISHSVLNSEEFLKIEARLAYNYMVIENEAEFTYWISITTFFHKACSNILNAEDLDSNDLKETINSSKNLEDLMSKITILNKKLFGDIEGFKEMMQEKSSKAGFAEQYAE
ncbi:MAG: hypothetical protein U0T69_11140 [Chitinophagales bacterium]